MQLKEHLRQQLVNTRQFSEQLLAAFHTPQDWTYQVHAQCNHALWFVGHIANTDNFFISLVAPDKVAVRVDFAEKFGPGSQPQPSAAAYPPVAEVLEFLQERRNVLLSILDEMDESQLEQKTPAGAPAFLPDYASVFRTAGWHEGLHAGQLTVVRRALGHPPLSNPPPN